MFDGLTSLGRGGLTVQLHESHFFRKSGSKLLSHLRKKESESPSKLVKLSEQLVLTKITQGNRMTLSFVVKFLCLSSES